MSPEERYQNKGKLGEGGMGTVYRAFDRGLMREVAIKVIRRDAILDQEARQRFDQEAKAAGMLNHPSIVTIYDRGELDGQPYIVMELVEGRTLDELVKESRPSSSQLLAVFRQVAAALDYAHSRQVVHRDIKPVNIMVHSNGTAKVMDFGIAKAEMGTGNLTAAGMMVGSPQYVPPERYSTGVVSGSTDLWALAVTAYEALAGQRPFQGDNWDTLIYQICHQQPLNPSQIQPSIPGAASAALLKALSKKPEDRFPTCSEFIDALAAGFAQQSVAAPPPPQRHTQPPSPPPPNRTKLYVTAGIAAALILAAVIWYITRPGDPPPPPKDPTIIQTKEPPPATLATPTGEMVLVTAGEARLGKQADRVVILPAFYVDKTEVSAGTYRQFSQETGRAVSAQLAAADADQPAVNVSFEDASAFAAWAGKRLPTAEEWEKAARGADGRPLPWGSQPDPSAANIPTDTAAAGRATAAGVTQFSAGASPYGALNMLGNVWEWTLGPADAPPAAQMANYRKIFADLSPALSESDTFFQARGGSFKFTVPLTAWPDLVWDFSPVPARARRPDIGFRCVRDVQ